MNSKARGFISSNAFAALSIYILPFDALESIPLFKNLSFRQPECNLRSLGWSSGSTVVNNFMFGIVILVIGLIHLILYLTKNRDSKYKSMILKVYKFFTLTIYIRIAIEAYMFTTLMLVSEINYFVQTKNDDNYDEQGTTDQNMIKGDYTSVFLSCLLMVLPILFLLLVFNSWKRNKLKIHIGDNFITRELYNGILEIPRRSLHKIEQEKDVTEDQELKETSVALNKIKIARLYYFIFLVRRLAMVLIIIFIPRSSLRIRISSLLILQITYLLYTIFVRSFEKIKDQVVEISNECVLLILIIFLTNYPSESDWTNTSEDTLIGIILSQLLILFLVSIANAIIQFVRYVKKNKIADSSADPLKQNNGTVIKKDNTNARLDYSAERQVEDEVSKENMVAENPYTRNEGFSLNRENLFKAEQLLEGKPNQSNQKEMFEEDKIVNANTAINSFKKP